MEKSKVYFTNMRTTPTNNLLDKMERLVRRAGIADIDFENKFVAIKIHFGEPGNLAYLRPQYAARMAAILRSLGAKPFLTDSNTLYSGKRANAVDHLQSAMENGYNPISAENIFDVSSRLCYYPAHPGAYYSDRVYQFRRRSQIMLNRSIRPKNHMLVAQNGKHI